MSATNDFKNIAAQFGLQEDDFISKERIIEALTHKVAYMMQYATEQLFSMLYRLDISEKKLKMAMQDEVDVAQKIAALIYERQIEKIISRNNHRPSSPEEGMEW